MGKVLILLGVVAAAALTWAMWPSSPPETGSGSAPVAKAGEAAPATPAGKPGERPAPPRKPAVDPSNQPVHVPRPGDPAEAKLEIPVEPTGEEPARALVLGQPAPAGHSGIARAPGTQPPQIPIKSLRQALKSFHDGLPASGRLTGPVYAEDLLPPELLEGLNVPGRSRVTMVGHYPVDDPKAFKSLLEQPEAMQTPVGFSFVTPDGREVRDYVFPAP